MLRCSAKLWGRPPVLVVGTAHAQALHCAGQGGLVWDGACSAGPAACSLWHGMLWCVVCQPHPRPSRQELGGRGGAECKGQGCAYWGGGGDGWRTPPPQGQTTHSVTAFGHPVTVIGWPPASHVLLLGASAKKQTQKDRAPQSGLRRAENTAGTRRKGKEGRIGDAAPSTGGTASDFVGVGGPTWTFGRMVWSMCVPSPGGWRRLPKRLGAVTVG